MKSKIVRIIASEDFICSFDEKSFLTKIDVTEPKYNGFGTCNDSNMILMSLKESVRNLRYSIYSDEYFYQIAQPSKNIENYKI